MITSATVREVIELYVKHGWLLRRVLLSERLRGVFALQEKSSACVVTADSDIYALWFSPITKPGRLPL